MKRVLITGSCGFVGSHLVEHLLKNTDWEIIGLDSFKHRGDSLRDFPEYHERYKIYCSDLSAPVSFRVIKKIGKVDYILNLASESHVDRSITEPISFVQNNVNLMLNVLTLARFLNVEKFVQISTDEVFGPALIGHNHEEWERCLPSNPYAASKVAQEAIAISYWRTFGVPLILTRTMNMIGERQDTEKFLPMLIKKINAGEEVVIHGNEKYIGTRYYLHARNQSDALMFILKNVDVIHYEDKENEIVYPECFNIVGDKELNNLELAQMVAGMMGLELKYRLEDFHSARPGHDRRYALDGKKLAERGWKAPISLEESIEKTISWTLQNPEWLMD